MHKYSFHGAAILILLAAPAHGEETIVGIWGHDAAHCKSDDRVTIKPLGIDSNYVICYFETVKRQADMVTWDGACHVDSMRRPETGSGEVMAVLKNGKLTVSGLGFGMNDLMRCK